MKKFNVTAICVPEKHYMINLESRISEIRKMVEAGEYFTINRSRQYGKTTTLNALYNNLLDKYTVLSLDFQSLGDASFHSEASFCQAFSRLVMDVHDYRITDIPVDIYSSLDELSESELATLEKLFRIINRWIGGSDKEIVLMIDEVDSATNCQVFLDFLAQLRVGYINRDRFGTPAFKSVILAGVTDIKRIKNSVRNGESSKENSPWNIAADFNIDMSFSAAEIADMLDIYAKDHHIDIDTSDLSKLIEDYTSGYPYLVSMICKIIDERLVPSEYDSLEKAWSRYGVDSAVRTLVKEENTLFQSLTSKINNFTSLESGLRRILMEGESISYNPLQNDIRTLEMYGFIRNKDGEVAISNRIFETVLYNLFLSKEDFRVSSLFNHDSEEKNIFIKNNKLDMKLVLERFIATYTQVFGPLEERFPEKDGRELFLLYLKPIINGTGNYYIEAQTRTKTRTDVVVDYNGEQFVVELKIWRGKKYNEEGEKQLISYLDYFQLDKGYMLSFNFNKHKKVGVREVNVNGRVVVEGVV